MRWDWTGRHLHAARVRVIPKHLAPILSRIRLDATAWREVVSKMGRMFKRVTGSPESLAQETIRSGQQWLCARENPLGKSTV